jgi:hypothetical protein
MGKHLCTIHFRRYRFLERKNLRVIGLRQGTPTFLIEQIRERDDLALFIEPQVVDSNKGDSNIKNIALLFQMGYLTIKKEEIIDGEIEGLLKEAMGADKGEKVL